MAEIRHRVGVYAPRKAVYDAVATRAGVAGWWTRDVRGDGALGAKLAFYFGRDEPSAVMDVVEATPEERVVWRCVDGPAEWIGTDVIFDLTSPNHAEGETVVLFTHAGWREPVEFMHHCSTRWGYFMLSLKAGLEGGRATPYPDDAKASSWN
jgi:uncharacterized protein YndB with AHSA1/START domain